MNVTVLGASGFIGRPLVAALRQRGEAVTTASTREPAAAVSACDGADVVVNLAGEPVAQRWTADAKRAIRASRVDGTRAIVDGFAHLERKPRAYVSASAIGYYGTSEDATFTESSPPGTDFLAEVCAAWEAEADRAVAYGMRVTKVRTGIVLGRDGGALAKLLPIFRIGGGGRVGDGKQWYSWVALEDQIGIYLHAIDGVDGVLDATAPNPVRNAEFTQALAGTVRRPAIFPVPAFALRAMLGEGAQVVVRGQRVLPERTLATGYRFRYETIGAALRAALGP
ncbi:MAG: TIGR01777 family protein [Candidatus Eremiobacteraeota bacterium]|nr:TIGR01777 family protein [Candidatus Eremiobacteraeota bacterium]MBC5804391.1 TIGR01777 family protein [Candidatus Eremiobacteraeota bacterium]MBC5821144.1 TIGR01777 family protein [Candidatus Eremiobacteraeota bacterium]